MRQSSAVQRVGRGSSFVARVPLLLAWLLGAACAPVAGSGPGDVVAVASPSPAGADSAAVDPSAADSSKTGRVVIADSIGWIASPSASIRGADGSEAPLDLFTRIELQGSDSSGVRVVCAVCTPRLEGSLLEDDLVTQAPPPEIAAWGTLPEFLLSIRTAAADRDLSLLRPVMVSDFTYAFVGIQTPDDAFAFWRSESFRSLDELAGLLDRGVQTTDGRIWSAPAAFVSNAAYRGPRAGFRRRPDGRWEWVYLIRNIREEE